MATGKPAGIYVKTMFIQLDDLGEADARINRWVDSAKVRVLDVKTQPVTGGMLYTLLYAGSIATGKNPLGPPVPLISGAKAPTVSVTRLHQDGYRPAQAMAGVFGVPEGNKLSMDDDKPAPVPVFSPDVDLMQYADLFGNTGGTHEQSNQ